MAVKIVENIYFNMSKLLKINSCRLIFPSKVWMYCFKAIWRWSHENPGETRLAEQSRFRQTNAFLNFLCSSYQIHHCLMFYSQFNLLDWRKKGPSGHLGLHLSKAHIQKVGHVITPLHPAIGTEVLI